MPLQALTSLPTWENGTLPGRIIIDVVNEPSLFQIKWNVTHKFDNNGLMYPSWTDLYIGVAEV